MMRVRIRWRVRKYVEENQTTGSLLRNVDDNVLDKSARL